MNENEINNLPSENDSVSSEERHDSMSDIDMEPSSPSTDLNEEIEQREGFTFNWFNLFLGVAFCFFVSQGGSVFSDDWTFYLYLSIVVIIHELGHVVFGKSFGCLIKEMQVFFLTFLSYKPHEEIDGNSWRNITWSLGVLPLGGVTVFKSRKSGNEYDLYGDETVIKDMELNSATSPYIEDKPAWQRMLISAAGVLFNIATFLILYFALPFMSIGCYDFFRPIAVLSLIIAVLNILPVYPLDGGAIVFALFEIITGKKPPLWITKACGWIGFIFIVLFFWVFPEWLNGILDSVMGLFF